MSTVEHNCGWVVAHTLHDCYNFLRAEQHRGREAVGIAGIGATIDVVKWVGTVERFDLVNLENLLPSSAYHTFFGHVRYATQGRKEKPEILNDAHPHTIGGTRVIKDSHMFVYNCDVVGVHNGQVDDQYFKGLSLESLVTGCDTEQLLHFYRDRGLHTLVRDIPGAFTLAFADKRRRDVVVVRDKHGMRPGVLGFKDGKYVAVSEDIALRKNGGELVENLSPGTVYYLSPEGEVSREQVMKPEEPRHCFFEWNYVAHVDSLLETLNVRALRRALGEAFAEEYHPSEKPDCVTFIPRCPEPTARRFSQVTGIPFIHIFYKERVERSFQGSTRDEQARSIRENLHLDSRVIPHIKGKRILVFDDSLIRGNVSQHARHLLYDEAGVLEATLMVYTPPIGIIPEDGVPRGCTFGVDIPPSSDAFVARGRTHAQIEQEIGMPVRYLSRQGMMNTFKRLGMNPDSLCSYCIGGPHPFKNPQ